MLRDFDTEGVVDWLSHAVPNLVMARNGKTVEIIKCERIDGAYLIKHAADGDLIAELTGASVHYTHAIQINAAVLARIKSDSLGGVK